MDSPLRFSVSLFDEDESNTAKKQALDDYKESIINGRQITPSVVFYNNLGNLCRVNGTFFESEQNLIEQIAKIMMLGSSIASSECLITFGNAVTYQDGSVKDSIITIMANKMSALAEPFPYSIVSGEVIYDETIELAQNTLCYPKSVSDIIAFGMKINSSIGKPSDVMKWLLEDGFDFDFYQGLTIEKIDKLLMF